MFVCIVCIVCNCLVRVAAVQSSYSPGTIMILVTAGAPRFCRAEYAGWRSVRVAVVVRIMHGSMLSKSTAGDSPIRRASDQAYNCRTMRKDRVWFDSCTPGHNVVPGLWRYNPPTPSHNYGTGHGWCSSYSSCRV